LAEARSIIKETKFRWQNYDIQRSAVEDGKENAVEFSASNAAGDAVERALRGAPLMLKSVVLSARIR
jgi:hypothetical protein